MELRRSRSRSEFYLVVSTLAFSGIRIVSAPFMVNETLTEKSILPIGPRTVLSCAGPQPSPVMPESQFWLQTLLSRPSKSSVRLWPRPSLRGRCGLGLLAAMHWSGATLLLFP